jgi:polygalacturonase
MKQCAGMRCFWTLAVKLRAQSNRQLRRWSLGALGCRTTVWTVFLLLAVVRAGHADPPLPVISNQVFVVTNTTFAGGAYGNGLSNSAAAINAAITYASGHGGGTVEIPTVGTLTNYMSGPITMASHVNLQIDAGAMLQMFPMSTWVPSYGTSTPFVDGATLTDAEISGPGTIDGQGTNWWYPLASSRPNFVEFDHCTRVLIQGVTLQNPPTFTIYLKNSDTSVTIQGITINTPFDSHNTDGFDISSTNVLIRNSSISTGDDDIEIGGSGAAATDITVSNCTFGTGHGVSIGSKIAGGVNNLLVSNCVFNGTEAGIKMKSDRGIGGLVQNLKYIDLTMTNVNFPIAMYMDYNTVGAPTMVYPVTPSEAAGDTTETISSTTPVYENIIISNLTSYGNSGIQAPGNIAGIMYGLPESPITNVTLYNVNIGGRTNDGTFCLYHVRGIQFINSNLAAPDPGTNTLSLYNAQFTFTNNNPDSTLMTMTGVWTPSNVVMSLYNRLAETVDVGALSTNPLLTLAGTTLTVSNGLDVSGLSTLNYGLGTNVTETEVTGNLTVGGKLNISNFGGFTNSTYTLFTYGGTLTYNGLTVGTVPNTNFTYMVSTNTSGQVNLVVAGSASPPPTASFSANPLSGAAPLAVTFTDSSSGSPAYWFWNFGDGGTSTNESPLYNYLAPGAWTAQLIASNAGGASSPYTQTINVYTPFAWWQQVYFGSTNCALCAANASYTGDGMSNTNKFLAGFNPTNAAAYLHIISVVDQGNTNIVVTYLGANGDNTYAPGIASRTNVLDFTTGDASGNYTNGGWQDTGQTNILSGGNGSGIIANMTDAGGATNGPSRYYRVRIVP